MGGLIGGYNSTYNSSLLRNSLMKEVIRVDRVVGEGGLEGMRGWVRVV